MMRRYAERAAACIEKERRAVPNLKFPIWPWNQPKDRCREGRHQLQLCFAKATHHYRFGLFH
jgi:hypothetical protein